MKRSYSPNSFSRFIPIILVIIITIVAVAAVIAIGRSLLGGGNSDQRQNEEVEVVDEGKAALLSNDYSRSVRLTVRGPIVADETFRSYRITVAPDARDMITYEGYLEKQIDAKNLNNNHRAYDEFVHALDKRNMMTENKKAKDVDPDLRGICATGKIYQFETLLAGEPVKMLWTSDCDGSPGTAGANVQEILDMFMKQIPDGNKMAAEIGLAQRSTMFRL